jgi:triacylglycerol lipase
VRAPMRWAAVAVLLAVQAAPAQDVPPTGQVPVLLVPGWFDTARELAPLRIRLVSAGWPSDHVLAITFADPTGSNVDHAREIGRAVDSLLARTGASRVDIVAHSMGGLAAREYLEGPGRGRVRRVVLLATPNEGTYTAYLAFGGGRDEMLPGSAFLDSLNAAPAVPPGVRMMTLRTPLDAHVLPPESARLPGVEDVEVCCPTHEGLLRDLEVFRIVRRFLSDGVVGEEER